MTNKSDLECVLGFAGFFVGGEQGASFFEGQNVAIDGELVRAGVVGDGDDVRDGVTVGAELIGEQFGIDHTSYCTSKDQREGREERKGTPRVPWRCWRPLRWFVNEQLKWGERGKSYTVGWVWVRWRRRFISRPLAAR